MVLRKKQWDMEFNPSTCQVIHITKIKTVIKHKYMLHGQVPESVANAKYLGLDLFADLEFNIHISRITSNANTSLGFIKRNVITKNEKVKELPYKSLVRPQVEYASTIWSPYTKTNIDQVEIKKGLLPSRL
jgi:hypothetical protein